MGLRIDHEVEVKGGAQICSPPNTALSESDLNEIKDIGIELDRITTRQLYGQEIKNNMAKRIKMIEDHMQVLTSNLQNAPSLKAAQRIAADISAFRGASEELGRWISGNF